MVNDLLEKISSLEKKLETLQTEVLQVHDNKVKIDESVLKDTVNEQITEYNNVRSQRNNVVIYEYDLPEQGDSMRDISLITELFNTLHTNDNGWSIDKVVRLGFVKEILLNPKC